MFLQLLAVPVAAVRPPRLFAAVALVVTLLSASAYAQSSSFPDLPEEGGASAPIPTATVPSSQTSPTVAAVTPTPPPVSVLLQQSAPSQQSLPPLPAAVAGEPALGWLPPVLPYVDGAEVPAGYERRSSGGTVTLTAGAIVFGGAYLGGLGVAGTESFKNGTGWMVVPLVGPWLAIADRDLFCDSQALQVQCVDRAEQQLADVALLTGAGVLQAVGFTLALVGIASREEQLVRLDVDGVTVEPTAGPQYMGVTTAGAF
jgi:hypothetical protein